MPRRCDIWRIGIVGAPIAQIVARGGIDGMATCWLPAGPDFTFLADPFGLWRGGVLHLFAESYDYRTRHGVIDLLRLDAALRPIDRRTVLREPWHLSYPYVFEAEGEVWMLPEAHRSGRLSLYRAAPFPVRWEHAATIDAAGPAVDATPFRHDGRWWLFHARVDTPDALHVAFAERLQGPWRVHPHSPLRVDRAGGRPGGTPFVADGGIVVPVQDCSRTYGGAIRPLRIGRLDPARIESDLGAQIVAPRAIAPFTEGLHTLAGCGEVTLVDVKRVDRTARGWLIDLARWRRGPAGG